MLLIACAIAEGGGGASQSPYILYYAPARYFFKILKFPPDPIRIV